MDYLAHFGLQQDPFSSDPHPDFWIELPEQDEAVARLERGVRQGRSLCLLVGACGSGKTTIARELFDRLEEEQFEASLLVVMQGGMVRGEVLQRIARQVGVEAPDDDRAKLLGQLHARLVEIRNEGRRAVVIVDEAQLLAAPETLEELRGLLNLEHDDRYLLTLVLIGQPPLERGLARLPAMAQRVDVKVRLRGLAKASVNHYIDQRIERAGGDPTILPPDSRPVLGRRAGGLPRVLNTLADNALFEAFLAKAPAVAPDHLDRAALDLDLLEGGEVATPEPASDVSLSPGVPTEGPPKDDENADENPDELEGILGALIEED